MITIKLNNQTPPITKHSKILGITLELKTNINITTTKAKRTLNILKELMDEMG